ncbi:MAG: hypothetical protein LBG58_03960 [Planctomycetaceae bacterium]|jgi:hypothetical protein|nr:hypothetical protein [Planctomycetaceae bacterium]
MSILENAKFELLDRLANNPLQDADDLTAYIQYACRLASLGDQSKIDDFPSLFAKEQFAGRIFDIIKERCEQGWFEIENYPGEDLALSLIDTQDFYLFVQRFGKDYPKLNPYFRKWFQDAEDVEINDECAEFLEAFLEKFPIPEEERLPVINTPITEREYALLAFAYKDIELPIIELQLQPSKLVSRQMLEKLYDPTAAKFLERPALLLSADDGKPIKKLQAMMQTEGTVKVKDKELFVEMSLNDVWQLDIEIKSDIPVERVRLGKMPAFQNPNPNMENRWNINLKMFADNIRCEFLEQPLFIQMSNGYRIKCFLSFL